MVASPRETRDGQTYVQYVLSLAYAGSVMAMTGIQLLTPALPAIKEALLLSGAQVGLVTSLYLLPGVVLTAPIGFLADRVGRRPVFSGALLLLGACGIVLLVVHNVQIFFAVRVIQGIAFAALLPITATMIGDVVNGREQVRAQAHRNIAMELGAAIMPFIGGLLVGIAWFAPFGVQLLSLPLAIVGWRVISPRDASERHAGNVRAVLKILRTSTAVALQIVGLVRFLLWFGMISYLPILLGERGAGPMFIAVTLAAPAFAGVISAALVPRILSRIRPSTVIMSCMAVNGLTIAVIATVPSLKVAVVAMLIFGVADTFSAVLQSSVMVAYVDGKHRASFVSAIGAVRNFGKFLAPTLIGGAMFLMSLSEAFLVLAGLATLAIPAAVKFRPIDGVLRDENPARDLRF